VSIEDTKRELEKVFGEFWEVELYFAEISDCLNGVYIIKLTTKGKRRISRSYIHHELGGRKFNDIYSELIEFARYINKEMLDSILEYSWLLRSNEEEQEISESEANTLLYDALSQEKTTDYFNQLVEHVKNNSDFYKRVSIGDYNPEVDHGILIDDVKGREKYGDYSVGLSRYTLLDLFIWNEEVPISRKDFINSGNKHSRSANLDKILQGFKDFGYLVLGNDKTRKNAEVNKPYKYLDKDGNERVKDKGRFYIFNCPELYKLHGTKCDNHV